MSQFEDYIKNVKARKKQKRSTKAVFEEYRAWKDGKLDKDTTMPLPPKGRTFKKKEIANE